MEPRKDDVRSAAQSTIHGPSGSASTISPAPEYPISGSVKPVLNYSIQTGEEFALEFMRDRAIPKKHLHPGMSRDQNVASGAGLKDPRGILGAQRAATESRFDASIFLAANIQQTEGIDRKSFAENENRSRHVSTSFVPRVPSGSGSSQRLSHGYASSESSDSSKRIKIMCSFGGKILPRPSDGKLRYVGGETHIIRISRNISWQELKQKTMAIYNQPHVIKYQLPGEDLDALISVSNDEDLRNMMEECGFLDKSEGSQKHRIFLVSIDSDDMSFSLGSMDSDSGIQYVVAINGMDVGTTKPSSGPINMSINELDQFINLNIDSNQPNSSRDGSNLYSVSASTVVPPAMMSEQLPVTLSSENTENLHSYHSHGNGMQNVQASDYSLPASNERSYDIEGQMSIPLSIPSGYRYTSQYAPYSGITSLHSFDKQSYQDTMKPMKEDNQAPDKVPPQRNELDYFQSLENLTAPAIHHDSSSTNYMNSEVPPTAFIQEGLKSSLQPSDSARSLETYTASKAMSATQGSECNEDDCHSSGAFASGCSDFQVDMVDHSNKNPPPHSGRVFHSERLPREQAGSLNRLSKSDDSLNSRFLILQSQSGVANESIAEASDPAFEGTEKSDLATWAINLNDPATVDSSILLEKEYANNVQQACTFSEQLLGEKQSSTDPSTRNAEKNIHAAENAVAKCNLNEATVDGVETVNQQLDHSAAPRHVSWDASNHAVSTDVDCDPFVPSTISLDDSRKEPIIPKKDNKDIAGGTCEKTSPDILSDFFVNTAAQSLSDFNDPVLSLNMQNYEPQRWSFFRNLAQNEFEHKYKEQDLAKIEEGVYPFARLEHDTINMKNVAPQNDIHVETHPVSSAINLDSSILPPGFISSQSDSPPMVKNVEGFQVDNPYTNMHEMMPPVPEFEEPNFEESRAVGPVMDASFKDNDFEYLQIIKNDDLEELRELGSGTFGTVYHGKWRGSDVAIKRIKKSCFTGRSSELERLANEFWREAEILSRLHHPNVVACYGVVKDGPGGTLATVTEFMVNGSLRHVLQRKDKYLDRRKRLIIAMDAAFGLEYLHSKNIVHFDLKCDNLLVNLKDQSRPICKVGDFGLSKIKRNTLVSGGVRGTLPWMAPELLNGSSNKVSEKVDVFSFGIVMWEILTGEEPYANMHYGAIIGGIVNNTLRPPVPASCDPEWRRLMEQCWAPDPSQRPAFTEIAGRLRAMSVAANQAKANSK
ncbi:hypothetical protein ABZP36_001064 [Zizania latifolia]